MADATQHDARRALAARCITAAKFLGEVVTMLAEERLRGAPAEYELATRGLYQVGQLLQVLGEELAK